MQGNLNSTRQRILKFDYPINDDDREKIKTSLSELDGVDEFKLENKQLYVKYQFPLITLSAILNTLNFVPDKHKLFKHFFYSLLAFMEQNERDYLIHSYGWYCYIEGIYIHFFDLSRKRKYKKQK